LGADCTGCSRHAGGDRTLADPMGDAGVDKAHAVRVVGWQHGVVAAELLDEAAVARRAAVGDHDVVVGALLGAGTGEADLQSHF
jgi:hypothetical protein